MVMEQRRPDCIEFHDAEVENIELRPNGAVTVTFSHLAVYFREVAARYGVWSMRATLECSGTRRLEFIGGASHCGDSADVLYEGKVTDTVTQAAIDATCLLDGAVNATLCLVWSTSGGRLDLQARSLRLELGVGKRFETYVGDL